MNDRHNVLGGDRITSRQIDELVGIARGLVADNIINQQEAKFLQKWLAANLHISDQPVIRTLYHRLEEMLTHGQLNEEERTELFETLGHLAERDFELGELLKPATLPLNDPAPDLIFRDHVYCFTGTFIFGQRKLCEEAVLQRGGKIGAITLKTNYLVIGAYATDSWKHSSFGTKILKACKYRDEGVPIALVSEEHWKKYLV